MSFTYRELKKKEEDDDQVLGAYLHKNRSKFSESKLVHVFVTTFNVNKRKPPIDLQQWLGRDTSSLPHLIAVGLQEAEDYFTILSGTYGNMGDTWLERIEANLPCGYQTLGFVKLSGILLALFHRANVPISDIQTETRATGLMGVWGNKGGVALSLRIYDTSVCFVNCHLDPGRNPDSAQVRNRQYHMISSIVFPSGATVFDHDAVIWMGDLNYRLRLPTSTSDLSVFNMCNTDQCLDLLEYDELLYQVAHGLAYGGFHEGNIKFRPTYRFLADQQKWNLTRFPAWCDRILWWHRKKPGPALIRQIDYTSVPEMIISDHKPVCSRLDLKCTKINWDKRDRVVSEFKKRTHESNECDSICCLKHH